MTFPNHYATLGVGPQATAGEIRRARRKLLKRHHPDSRQGDAARTREILAASDILLDPVARAQYDAERFGTLPAVPPSARPRDLQCPACGHANRKTVRHWCAWCGAGIGETPRPVRRQRPQREVAGRNPALDAAAGASLGGLAGTLTTIELAQRVLLADGVFLSLMALPALFGGLIGWLFGDRLWDWVGTRLAPPAPARPGRHAAQSTGMVRSSGSAHRP